MKRIVLAVVGGLVAVAVGVVVWFFALSGSGAPTGTVTAPTLDASGAAGSRGEVFVIGDGTTARFRIDEVLRGRPNTVVGSTTRVAGQILLDRRDASRSQVGAVVVDARTFGTDSGLRDRAIRGLVLDTAAFESIRFEPATIEGLEGTVAVGDTKTFSVSGDLTVRGITKPATFGVTAALVAADRIEATATATVSRSDFAIPIPSVAAVANVGDEVTLELDLVATRR